MSHSILRPLITGESALRICGAVLAQARKQGQAVVVAVVDPSGTLVAYVAEQGAPRISQTVARDKAFTAAMTGMSSEAWKQIMEQMPANEREIVLRAEGYVGTEGGLPIFEAGRLIGGVGVSGAASGAHDAALAHSGLAALEAAG